MLISEVLKVFKKQLDEFIEENKNEEHKPDEPAEVGNFYIYHWGEYYLVDTDKSYWYIEDDGTVVYRINDLKE